MRTLLGAGALVASLLVSPHAHAALDEVLHASASDVARLHVADQTLHVRTRGTLKEFATPGGKIFAAMWTGRSPDLTELLGTHYAEYEQARLQRRPGGHGVMSIRTPELTVTILSRGRLLLGKAVLTNKLPKGVTVDALR